jgi:hypothetical protein
VSTRSSSGGTSEPAVDEISKKMKDFEAMLDAFRQVSEMLKGATAELVRQGWSEPQAQEIVVATYVNSVKQKKP